MAIVLNNVDFPPILGPVNNMTFYEVRWIVFLMKDGLMDYNTGCIISSNIIIDYILLLSSNIGLLILVFELKLIILNVHRQSNSDIINIISDHILYF